MPPAEPLHGAAARPLSASQPGAGFQWIDHGLLGADKLDDARQRRHRSGRHQSNHCRCPWRHTAALVVAIGKDHNAYLLDRANLGGVTAPIAQSVVSSGLVINSPATYRTSQGHLRRAAADQWDIDRVQDNARQSADDCDRLECEFDWAHLALCDIHRWHEQPDRMGIWTRARTTFVWIQRRNRRGDFRRRWPERYDQRDAHL